MIVKTKITFREYVKLLYSLAYQRTLLRLLVGVAVVLILWILLYFGHFIQLPKPVIYQYITLILIVVVQPIVIFITIRRNYNSSNHLREPLEMKLLKDEMSIQGESFFLRVEWEKMFKIVEKADWFLIYQNNLSAIIIPKKDMSADNIIKLRNILNDLRIVPVELENK